IDIHVGRPRKEARCPGCGRLTRRVHAYRRQWREVLHSRCEGRPVYLRLRPRRFWCKGCEKAFTETLPGIEKWSRHTGHAEEELLKELAGRSFRNTARWAGTGSGTLRR